MAANARMILEAHIIAALRGLIILPQDNYKKL